MNEDLNRANASGAATFIPHKITSAPIYYDNAFVTHGPYSCAGSIDDPYVNFTAYIDPNPATPTRPFNGGFVAPVSTLDQMGAVTGVWDVNDSITLRFITSHREYDSNWGQACRCLAVEQPAPWPGRRPISPIHRTAP